jgi:hypothetical protein
MKIFYGLNELQSLIKSEQQGSLCCGLHFAKAVLNGCRGDGNYFYGLVENVFKPLCSGTE